MWGLDENYTVDKHGDAVRKLPRLRVSAMPYLTHGFNFIVTLNEFTYGFQSVSDIHVTKGVEYIQEGGVNDHQLMVGKPQDDTPTLSFKRGLMVRSPAVFDALLKAGAASIGNNLLRKAALLAAAALDPQESLEGGPAVGTIQVYNRNRKLTGLYSFFSLGITQWRLDDLDSTNGSNLLIEEFTLAHTGITRVPLTIMPSLGNVISTYKEDKAAVNNARAEEEKAKAAQKEKEAKEAEKELENKQQEIESKEEETKNQEEELKEENNRLKELEEELEKEESAEDETADAPPTDRR